MNAQRSLIKKEEKNTSLAKPIIYWILYYLSQNTKLNFFITLLLYENTKYINYLTDTTRKLIIYNYRNVKNLFIPRSCQHLSLLSIHSRWLWSRSGRDSSTVWIVINDETTAIALYEANCMSSSFQVPLKLPKRTYRTNNFWTSTRRSTKVYK